MLEAILYRGELKRGEIADLLNTGDRNARRVTSALLDHGVLESDSTRAPLRQAFPATLALDAGAVSREVGCVPS